MADEPPSGFSGLPGIFFGRCATPLTSRCVLNGKAEGCRACRGARRDYRILVGGDGRVYVLNECGDSEFLMSDGELAAVVRADVGGMQGWNNLDANGKYVLERKKDILSRLDPNYYDYARGP